MDDSLLMTPKVSPPSQGELPVIGGGQPPLGRNESRRRRVGALYGPDFSPDPAEMSKRETALQRQKSERRRGMPDFAKNEKLIGLGGLRFALGDEIFGAERLKIRYGFTMPMQKENWPTTSQQQSKPDPITGLRLSLGDNAFGSKLLQERYGIPPVAAEIEKAMNLNPVSSSAMTAAFQSPSIDPEVKTKPNKRGRRDELDLGFSFDFEPDAKRRQPDSGADRTPFAVRNLFH